MATPAHLTAKQQALHDVIDHLAGHDRRVRKLLDEERLLLRLLRRTCTTRDMHYELHADRKAASRAVCEAGRARNAAYRAAGVHCFRNP